MNHATANQGVPPAAQLAPEAAGCVGKTYNHAFTLAFSVSGSKDKYGADITAEQFYQAIIPRAQALMANHEMLEAIGMPFDSFAETGAGPRSGGSHK